MTKTRGPLLIPWHLILIFLVLAAGIGTAGYLYYAAHERHIRRTTADQLASIADLKVREISRWRRERLADAQVVSEDHYLASRIERLFGTPTDPDLRREVLARMESLRRNYDYDSVVLLDAKGEVRYAVPEGKQVHAAYGVRMAEEAMRAKKAILSDFHENPTAEHGIYITLIAPLLVRNDGDTSAVGAILLRIDPHKFLYPFLQSWPTRSATAETVLIRREGDDVLYLNELWHQKNAALALRIPASREDLPAAMAARGEQGMVEGVDYRGKRVLAAIRAIPDSPWFMIAKVDHDEIHAACRRNAELAGITVALLILAAGVSLGFFWRQQSAESHRRQYQAELERQALERRFDYLSKYANDIILLMDRDLRIIEANDRAVTSYGYTRDELLQMALRELRLPDDQTAFDAQMKKVGESNGFVYETVHRRKDGTTFPVEVSSRLIEAEGKEVRQSIIRDITERKRAEEALLQSERELAIRNRIANVFLTIPDEEMYAEVLKVLLDALQSKYGVFGYIDENGALVVPSMTRHIWDQCEVPEKDIVFPRHKWGDSIWPRAIREKKALHSNEPSTLVPKGHVPILRNITVPILHHDEVIGLFQVANKATDYNESDLALAETIAQAIAPILNARLQRDRQEKARRQAEETLGRSEERYRSLVIATAQIVWTTDPQGQVIDLPDWRAFTGQSQAEVKGWGWTNALHPDDRERTTAVWTQAVTTRSIYDTEYRVRCHDGTYRWFAARGVPVLESDGRIREWVGTCTDITERKRAEEEIRQLNAELEQRVRDRTAQLEAANRELEAFSYSVSHDLRTPLRAVDGYGRMLLEDYTDRLDGEGQRVLGVIFSETKRMGELIDDLLAFSQLGRRKMEFADIDMTALARAVFEEQATQAPKRAVQLELKPLAPACGDRAMIRVVWVNLLSNAIKFTKYRDPALIEIGSCQKDSQTVYYVKDDGVGFDMKYMHKLFGIFQRLHSAEEFEGTGVGLALVQRIVHRHGGRVWAEGKVNEGATFYFWLSHTKGKP